MLIEKVVFNFKEVEEESLSDIKNECMADFAVSLKEALISNDERIRKFWLDSSTTYGGDSKPGSIANYKVFSDLYGSKIKYNSKNIVFEETITNNPSNHWNLRETCAGIYGLKWVKGTEEHSAYYEYRKDGLELQGKCPARLRIEERPEAKEYLRNFYKAFSVGEFPFMTVTVIRLGNKDHFFYSIHR